MLRLLFVCGLVAIGAAAAVQSAFGALLFYLWNAYFRPEQWVYSSVVGQMHLSFTIAIVLGLRTVIDARFQWNSRLTVIALIGIQGLISAVFAETADWSWMYLEEFSTVLIITYLIVLLVNDEQRLRTALLVIAVSLGLEAMKQGWVDFLLHPGSSSQNGHPVLGDNNGVAHGLLMLIPIFFVLYQTASTRFERWFHVLALVGLTLRTLTTYSRGGMVAALAISLFRLGLSRNRLRIATLSIILATGGSLAMPSAFWQRMGTITSAEDERDDSARGRLHFWNVAVRMVSARPFEGVGIRGFQTSYDKYDDSDGEFGTGRAVHSTWFGITAELGLPGLGWFLLNLTMAFVACDRVRRAAKTMPTVASLGGYAIALETSLIAYAVAGTFLNSQYSELYWHLIGLTTALHAIARPRIAAARAALTPVPHWTTAGRIPPLPIVRPALS
jgi:probable O-glycosylation ligase (exosortase A-associated)